MRNLAYGPYTHDQVYNAIRAGNIEWGKRYEILDRRSHVLPQALTTVISGSGDHNVERDVKGSLKLKLWPFELLRDAFLRYLIRPWIQVQMLAVDGKWAEYPMGAYLWSQPERTLGGIGLEQWDVALADQTWLLDLTAPDPIVGFKINKGQVVTDVIKDIYRSLGFTDLSGIVDSPETFAEGKFYIGQTPNTPEYGLRRDTQSSLEQVKREIADATDAAVLAGLQAREAALAQQMAVIDQSTPSTDESAVTNLGMVSQFQAGIGYTSPMFDWVGRPIAKPMPDLTSTSPQHHYRTDERSIISGLKITPDLSTIANRVVVKASNASGIFGQKQADANDLYPNHSLAERNIGIYITPPVIEDSTAGSLDALQARANAELGVRLTHHKRGSMTTGFNPAHEPYDLSGVQYDLDPELGDEVTVTQPNMTFDLDNPGMGFDIGLVAL